MSLDTLLLASLSADSKTRIQAEESLSRDVSAIDLMRYVKQSTDLASRLSALVYLKNYVLQHWSAQFAEYKGQLCSEEVKHVIRHDCYSLIGDSKRVVRAQAGFITSKIIAADYPEEWATVLDDLLSNLARPISEEWLDGSLIVMKDFVEDSMSEEQFLPIAQNLVGYLLNITRNAQYRGEIRAQAVDVFLSCLDALEMLSSTRKEGIRVFVDNALPPWLETIVGIINDNVADIDLRNKATEAILKLRLLFPSQLVQFLPAIFKPVYESLKATDINECLNKQSISLQMEFIRRSLQAKIVVEEILSQLDLFQGCIALALKFAQITPEIMTEWTTDVDLFVEDLEETAFSTRHLCTDLLDELRRIKPDWHLTTLQQAQEHYFGSSTGTEEIALQQEALIFCMISIKEESQMKKKIFDVALSSSDRYLFGRATIYAAQLGQEDYFEKVSSCLTHSDIVIRLCSIKALYQYANNCPDLVRDHQPAILAALTTRTELLPASALLMLAETIQPIIQLESDIALSPQSPLPGLLSILARNPGDISLVSTVVDIFESLAASVNFEALCTAILPVLFQTIEKEPALRSIALEILNGIIQGSEKDLPAGFVDSLWPLFSIPLEIEEQQTAHEILRNLVDKAWIQITQGQHVEQLLSFIASAFSGGESASFYIPQLVVSLIRQAGEQLAGIMPRLLEIIIDQLQLSSLSSEYQQSLILVFAEMATTQAEALVNFLVVKDSLEAVMRIWTDIFPDFHGYASIRTSVVGLANIFLTGHQALANIEVKGDLIPDTSGRIQTRSRTKTNPDRYTSIGLPLKIIKLFVAELVNEMEGRADDEEVVSDDDWDSTDIDAVIEDPEISMTEDARDPLNEINTKSFIQSFLQAHAQPFSSHLLPSEISALQ